MNEQLPTKPDHIEWTRIMARLRGIRFQLRGYTSNPVAGCNFGCQFQMPDGGIAQCYAKTIAEQTMVRRHYPFGFAHYYFREHELEELRKFKKSAGVFLGSMGDLMDYQVPDKVIWQILDTIEATPWITYFILTKQATRLKRFKYPTNVWVGASMPPTTFKGQKVSALNYLYTTFDALDSINTSVKWMSLEPLSFDMAEHILHAPIQWAVIGAATHYDKIYQPNPEWVTNTVDSLHDKGTAVFYKGNLKGNPACKEWLEEFPKPSVKCRRCGELWFSPVCPACNDLPKDKVETPDNNQLTLF